MFVNNVNLLENQSKNHLQPESVLCITTYYSKIIFLPIYLLIQTLHEDNQNRHLIVGG